MLTDGRGQPKFKVWGRDEMLLKELFVLMAVAQRARPG